MSNSGNYLYRRINRKLKSSPIIIASFFLTLQLSFCNTIIFCLQYHLSVDGE